MTPKEKAKELIRQFYSVGAVECKQCALIAVDEILNMSKIASIRRDEIYMELEFFIEVKQEIKKL